MVIGGGEPYHLTLMARNGGFGELDNGCTHYRAHRTRHSLMARNGGFGELDNGYIHLRTIRVKSDPVADGRVGGAPLGALLVKAARSP